MQAAVTKLSYYPECCCKNSKKLRKPSVQLGGIPDDTLSEAAA